MNCSLLLGNAFCKGEPGCAYETLQPCSARHEHIFDCQVCLKLFQSHIVQPGMMLIESIDAVRIGIVMEIFGPSIALDDPPGQGEYIIICAFAAALNNHSAGRFEAALDALEHCQVVFYSVQAGKGRHYIKFSAVVEALSLPQLKSQVGVLSERILLSGKVDPLWRAVHSRHPTLGDEDGYP
jgi:hypothetical protein